MKTAILVFLALLLPMGAAMAAGPATASLEFRLVVDCGPGDKILSYSVGGVPVTLCTDEPAFLTAADIIAAADLTAPIPNLKQTGIPDLRGVEVTLTPEATARVTAVTREHEGEEFAILSAGKVLSIMQISETIRSRTLDVQFAMDDAGFTSLLRQWDKKAP